MHPPQCPPQEQGCNDTAGNKEDRDGSHLEHRANLRESPGNGGRGAAIRGKIDAIRIRDLPTNTLLCLAHRDAIADTGENPDISQFLILILKIRYLSCRPEINDLVAIQTFQA